MCKFLWILFNLRNFVFFVMCLIFVLFWWILGGRNGILKCLKNVFFDLKWWIFLFFCLILYLFIFLLDCLVNWCILMLWFLEFVKWCSVVVKVFFFIKWKFMEMVILFFNIVDIFVLLVLIMFVINGNVSNVFWIFFGFFVVII